MGQWSINAGAPPQCAATMQQPGRQQTLTGDPKEHGGADLELVYVAKRPVPTPHLSNKSFFDKVKDVFGGG